MNLAEALDAIAVRQLGCAGYEAVYGQMRRFSAARDARTPDELWLVEHPPVYTLGQAGRPDHLLRPNGIALVRADRGGQITYHGPGQAVLYTLLDLARRGLGVGETVRRLEQAIVDLLCDYGVRGARRSGAPGVYVGEAKIAALGLRVRHGRCYHGLALNIDMDLSPFADVDPCGYPGMPVTQMADLGVRLPRSQIEEALIAHVMRQFGGGPAR